MHEWQACGSFVLLFTEKEAPEEAEEESKTEEKQEE